MRSLSGIILIACVLLCVTVAGQVSTGEIQGTVKDQTGAAIPGVEVSITNTGTAVARTVLSDEAGRFSARALPIGNYEVKAELPGFQTVHQSGIELTVGSQRVVDIVMPVGEISEIVEVTSGARLVDTTSSDVSALVDSKTMRELPLNGRNYAQLATLQTGVVFSGRQEIGGAETIAGPGLRFNVNGTRGDGNSFLLDGQDIQDTFNATPASGGGETLGVETLQEFEVKTSNYSAEYSKASGAVISAVTKSGTNEIHGNAFWFHRNDNVDAANFFDNSANNPKPEFKRNQFGATIGGPIVENRTFWFFGYEGLREGLGRTLRFTVPTASALIGDIDGDGVAETPIDPRVQPYLDALFPFRPNGQIFSGGRGEYFEARTNVKNDDFFTGKVDHQFNEQHSLNVRYTADDGSFVQPGAGTLVASSLVTLNQYLSGQIINIFSPTVVNTFTAGWNRSRLQDLDEEIAAVPSTLAYPGFASPGQLNVTGFTGLGYGTLRPRDFTQNIFEFRDTVSITRGRHQIRIGGVWQRFHNDVLNALWQTGNYSFGSWADFLAARPRTFLSADPGTEFFREFRNNVIGMFVQDDFQATPNLTLNLGLRYEFITVPTDTKGRIANLRTMLDPEITVGDPMFENPSLLNFAPRVGFAWDPFGDGKTSIRGGGGIFHNQILANQWRFMMTGNPPFSGTLFQFRPPFPNAVETAGAGGVTAHQFPFEPEQAVVYQWNLTIQRELFPQTVLSVGYVGTRGVHLGRSQSGQDANLADPTAFVNGRKFFRNDGSTLPRRNPNFNVIRALFYDANSFYHGLQVSLRRRLARGFQFQTSYTWSNAIDEASGIWGGASTTATTPQDILDPGVERGAASFDFRHNFVFNMTYDLPSYTGDGALRTLLDGWQLSGILSLSTALPFTITSDGSADPDGDRSTSDLYPELVGASNNPIREDPRQWFDPSAFTVPARGFYGSLGRNTLRADGFSGLDLALMKNTPLGEHVTMQFRAEMFNLLNHANFRPPSVREIFINVPDPTPRADAGRVTSTAGTARQIQFALKFIF